MASSVVTREPDGLRPGVCVVLPTPRSLSRKNVHHRYKFLHTYAKAVNHVIISIFAVSASYTLHCFWCVGRPDG
jgi:hypothetical protein